MTDLEELRRKALEEQEVQKHYDEVLAAEVHDDTLFGMTAVERMFVSIGCFLATTLGGFLLLLVMDKIAI